MKMLVLLFGLMLTSLAENNVIPLSRVPELPATTDALATARQERDKDRVAAGRAYRAAVNAKPDDAALRCEVAEFLAHTGQPREAAEHLTRAWELVPTPATARRLVELWTAANMPAAAAWTAEAALRRFPEDMELIAAAATALAALGELQRAQELATRLTDTTEASPETHLARARVLQAADQPAEAWRLVAEVNTPATAEFRRQLRDRAFAGAGAMLFPPPGWLATDAGLVSPGGAAVVRWHGPEPGKVADLARLHAAGGFGRDVSPLLELSPPDTDERPPDAPPGPTWETRALPGGIVTGVLTLTLPLANTEDVLQLATGAIAVPAASGNAVLVIEPPQSPATMWQLIEQLGPRLVAASGEGR